MKLVLLVCLVACHRDGVAPIAAPAPTPTPTPAPAPAPAAPIDATPAVDASVAADAAVVKRLGKHGDVCSYGSRHQNANNLAPAECGPGLECCYPCGIAGCDSVCHTATECDLDKQRPARAPSR